MMVRAFMATALVFAAAGCSSDPEVADDPETSEKLERCAEDRDDKDRYIEELEKRLAELEIAGDDEVVVRVEGDELTISGRGPHERAASSGATAGGADDSELYEAFLQRTRRSRQAIARCYQNALKNDTSLQARTIQLEIAVDYHVDGEVSGASFSPSLSSGFRRCMETVTERWEIPASPSPVTFKRRITLTPE